MTRGVLGALALVLLMVGGTAGFWFFRLRTQPMPVAVRNQTAADVMLYVNGVPARLLTAAGGCADGDARRDADFVPLLKPGEEGWFCRTARGGRTGSHLCYEARTASGDVLAAVQWNGDDWIEHGSALVIGTGDQPEECHVTVGG